ncbi:MAG: hypothetical protein AAFU03_17615, partial [Bacteroidota bacterium]
IDEGIEVIRIALRRNPCIVDTFEIRISENLLEPSMLPDSVLVCPGDTVVFNATLPVEQPPPPRFTSSGTVNIGIPPAEYSSFINMTGIVPATLGPGVIKSVCIDSLTHQWIDDLDIYLIGPNGQILELTTDNGADGGNGFGEDGYIGTCFTPNATQSIRGTGNNAPASFVPFTGEWQPEGNFSDLWAGNFSTNGNWELRIIDDANFGIGRLWEWSICLEPVYSIDYSWTPENSLSCIDCPVTEYLSEQEGYFYVTATDSYGCSLSDSIFTEFRPVPTIEPPTCGFATDSSLQIFWSDIADALSYEVRIDGRSWTDVGLVNEFTFMDLFPDSNYVLYVRAIFSNCPSPQESVVCRTLPCTPPNLSVMATDPSCFSFSDGRLDAGI